MKKDNSEIIAKDLYSFVANKLKTNSRKFLANIYDFINTNHEKLFDIAPYTNIYFNKSDLDKMYKSLGFEEKDVIDICKNIYYWDWPGYNPTCAKEPYVLILLCAIRYYLKNSETKNAEITSIYLAFSGKIYASLYGLEWKYTPNKQVMDFVVNTMLSEKFDLKKEGSVFNAIKKLCLTWLDTYKKVLIKNETTDEDCGKAIQQLRDRVKSFMKNIAKLYYEAYENKSYLNYETDSLDQDDFHLTDNDAAIAARITEAAMNILSSQKVDFEICKACVNTNVKSYIEIGGLMEGILSNKENLPQVRRIINIIICDFLENVKGKRVGSGSFVEYSMKAKPNSKSKIYIEMKQTINKWLDENSADYRRRKSRIGTANDYYRCVLCYLVLTICKVSG